MGQSDTFWGGLLLAPSISISSSVLWFQCLSVFSLRINFFWRFYLSIYRLSFPKLLLSIYSFRSRPFILEVCLLFLIPSVVCSRLSGGLKAEYVCGLVDWKLPCLVIWLGLLSGGTLISLLLGPLRVLRKGSSTFSGWWRRAWLPVVWELGGEEGWKSEHPHVPITPSWCF